MKLKIVFLILAVFLFSWETFAQNDELEKLLNVGIEELLEAEIVSASKSKQKIEDVSANVQVVTAREIKERGYQSIEELLADLPGFQFRNIQGFNSYVFQRGVASQNNLILMMIDGVQVNELNSGGFYGGSQYLMSNIEQVEIVYGPASVLYGTNAISGIVNVITKKENNEEGLDATVSSGSFNTYSAALGFGANNPGKECG
ncbi:MAG: hypothetical protein EOM73_12705, partial [Bacteroidia bacterium]|nr:hypothetical protein [Bacteroidia bacterium]